MDPGPSSSSFTFNQMSDWNTVVQNLSRVNGRTQIGIAAGVDPELPEYERLIVPALDAEESVKDDWARIVIHSALGVAQAAKIADEKVVVLMVSAAVALYKSGMIGKTSDIRTIKSASDRKILPSLDVSRSDFFQKVAREAVKENRLQEGALGAFSTKVNYFATNHHVGTAELQGFPRKVVSTVYLADKGAAEEVIQRYYKPLHIIGHWGCTARILTHLGFKEIRRPLLEPVVAEPAQNQKLQISATRDVTMRVCNQSVPAGASKFGLCIAIIRRLFRHPMVVFVPGIANIATVAAMQGELAKQPLAAHVGSHFLIGRQAATQFNDAAEQVIGRLGTFICLTSPRSSIAKSPHLADEKYREYEDFDPNWHALLVQYKTASVIAPEAAKGVLAQLTGGLAAGDAPVLNAEALQVIGVSQEDLRAKFQIAHQASAQLGVVPARPAVAQPAIQQVVAAPVAAPPVNQGTAPTGTATGQTATGSGN
jgi:hypothetical protein